MAHSLWEEWEVLSWHRNGRTTILPKCGPPSPPLCCVGVVLPLHVSVPGEGEEPPSLPPNLTKSHGCRSPLCMTQTLRCTKPTMTTKKRPCTAVRVSVLFCSPDTMRGALGHPMGRSPCPHLQHGPHFRPRGWKLTKAAPGSHCKGSGLITTSPPKVPVGFPMRQG